MTAHHSTLNYEILECVRTLNDFVALIPDDDPHRRLLDLIAKHQQDVLFECVRALVRLSAS